MKKAIRLKKFDSRLWTRPAAQAPLAELRALLDRAEPGESVVIDMAGVEVFDFSFANEFFGKTMLALPRDYPGRLVIVENLSEYTREDLAQALASLNLAMIERNSAGALTLLGKYHAVDGQTFAAIATSKKPVTAAGLKDQLGINLTAVNERLTKLTSLGLVHRAKGVSPAGREQYEYTVLG